MRHRIRGRCADLGRYSTRSSAWELSADTSPQVLLKADNDLSLREWAWGLGFPSLPGPDGVHRCAAVPKILTEEDPEERNKPGCFERHDHCWVVVNVHIVLTK